MAVTNQHYFDTAQLAAIQTDAARAVVLSAAGSGKTMVIVEHIRYIVESGVSPAKILCLTFTVAAARVMESRLGYRISYCGNLHAWLLRLLNAHGALIGFAPGVGVIDEERADDLLAEIVAGHRYKGTKDDLDAARKDWSQHCFNPTKAQLCISAFRRRLRESNTVDFDGILHFGKRVVERLAERKEWRWTHLLVDECQDSSNEHFEIYEVMPVEKRFYCGDMHQRIMGFLGAGDAFEKMARNALTNAKM